MEKTSNIILLIDLNRRHSNTYIMENALYSYFCPTVQKRRRLFSPITKNIQNYQCMPPFKDEPGWAQQLQKTLSFC